MSTLILFWQFILKGIDELSVVSNPVLSLEMILIRLIHLKDMPSYESVLNLMTNDSPNENIENTKINITKNQEENNKISKDQIKNTIQTKPELKSVQDINLAKDNNFEKISSLEDLINLSSKKREIELKYDLEKNVNLISFSDRKIDISLNENLAKNFVKKLSEKLFEWTGKRWLITLTKGAGQKTFSEMQTIKNNELIEKEKNGEIYKKFKNVFNDVELLDVTKKE